MTDYNRRANVAMALHLHEYWSVLKSMMEDC